MVELASKVMIGQPLVSLGYGTGLYRTPPYFAVKVPVFSFEKLSDVNSILGPEMKSTGEVLGIGKTTSEALMKGLTSAGFNVQMPSVGKEVGVLLSVDEHDEIDVVTLAKKLDDLGMKLYATKDTAAAIGQLGIDVTRKGAIREQRDFPGHGGRKNQFIVFTGRLNDSTSANIISITTSVLFSFR